MKKAKRFKQAMRTLRINGATGKMAQAYARLDHELMNNPGTTRRMLASADVHSNIFTPPLVLTSKNVDFADVCGDYLGAEIAIDPKQLAMLEKYIPVEPNTFFPSEKLNYSQEGLEESLKQLKPNMGNIDNIPVEFATVPQNPIRMPGSGPRGKLIYCCRNVKRLRCADLRPDMKDQVGDDYILELESFIHDEWCATSQTSLVLNYDEETRTYETRNSFYREIV